MNAIDIVCLIPILAGVIFIVVSFVRRRKGMWYFNSENYAEPWDSVNPEIPHYRRSGGLGNPYAEMQIGISLIIVGLLGFVYSTFGLKVCAAAVMAVSVASLVFNGVRLCRLDDDDELRSCIVATLLLSGFALFFGGLTFFLI